MQSLEQLRQNILKTENSNNSGPNNYYPFWNMKVGEQTTVRFLPDLNENNPKEFFIEKAMHTLVVNGETKSVPCLKMYGEDCPICKVSAAFYKKDDKVNGKKYWRKKQYITQAIVVEDPLPSNEETGATHVGQIRFLALGQKIYESIIEGISADGDLEDSPVSFENGTNFIIKKRQQGEYADYSRSSFAKRSTALSDEQIASVKENSVDLSTLLPKKPDLEKIEQWLELSLNGGKSDSDSDSDSDLSQDNWKVSTLDNQPSFRDSIRTSNQKSNSDSDSGDSSDFEDATEDYLSRIRASRQNKRKEQSNYEDND